MKYGDVSSDRKSGMKDDISRVKRSLATEVEIAVGRNNSVFFATIPEPEPAPEAKAPSTACT